MDLLVTLFVASAILSILVAWVAGQRGRSPGAWFLISLFFSPVIALLALLAAGPATGRGRTTTTNSPGLDLSRLTDDDLDAIRRHHALQRHQQADPLGLGKPTETVLLADGQQHTYTVLQLQDAYKAGQLQPTDHYWDPAAEQWLELTAHPRLS
jgi:hypothetical protein